MSWLWLRSDCLNRQPRMTGSFKGLCPRNSAKNLKTTPRQSRGATSRVTRRDPTPEGVDCERRPTFSAQLTESGPLPSTVTAKISFASTPGQPNIPKWHP